MAINRMVGQQQKQRYRQVTEADGERILDAWTQALDSYDMFIFVQEMDVESYPSWS